jgi:hypothetical protein
LALRPSAAAARRPIFTGGGGVAFWSAAAAFGGVNDLSRGGNDPNNAQFVSIGLYFKFPVIVVQLN